MTRLRITLASLLFTAGIATAFAVEKLPSGYVPLFTQQQIDRASVRDKARMIDSERRNREAWNARSQQDDAPVSTEATKQQDRAATVNRVRKQKVYRWVDSNGRVNFGDRPPGQRHEEVRLQSTAPPQGARERRSLSALAESD